MEEGGKKEEKKLAVGARRSVEARGLIFEGGEERYLTDLLVEAKKCIQEKGNPERRNGVTYAFFGSSGSGKTTLLRKVFLDDVYRNKKAAPSDEEYVTVLFTGSKYADPLKNLDRDQVVVDPCGLNEDIYKWMYAMNFHYEKIYNFVVAIDDVIQVKNLPVVYDAFLTYRNMNITSIVSLQYLKLCPLAVRSSLYFAFLLPLNSNEGIEQLIKGYLGMFLRGKTLSEKIALYRQLCEGHCFFLMDNLNHKCYYVSERYYARELKVVPRDEVILGSVGEDSLPRGEQSDGEEEGGRSRKRKRGGRK